MSATQLLLKPTLKTPSRSKAAPRVTVPAGLHETFRKAVASSKLQQVASKRKALINKAKHGLLVWWAQEYASNGAPPSMANFVAGDAEAGFLVASRSDFNAEKAAALEKLGVELEPYVQARTLQIKVQGLSDQKVQALTAAIDAILTKDEAQEAISVQHQMDAASFIQDLPELSQKVMKTDEPSAKGICALVEAAGIQQQLRGARIEGTKDEDLLSVTDG